MQLLCLGDIALADKDLAPRVWDFPGGLMSGVDSRVMFNWEFPIGDIINPNPRVRGMRFMAFPGSPKVVQKWVPGIATMATNHILDAGSEGIVLTIKSLQQKGFTTVGAGITPEEIAQPVFWETADGKLAIINWVFAETHPDWMVVPGPNCWPGPDEARRIIQDLKLQVNWVLVVAHWSDELFAYPLPQDRELARELADMGVDVIVGHHPHVVRGMEVIGSCQVFYSIGNFYFAEKLNSSDNKIAPLAPRNREGLGVRFTFKHGREPEYELLSFWNTKQEALLDSARRALRRMQSVSTPLQKYHGNAYVNWYKIQRARFDKWGSRWHFGLLRRGVIGTLRRVITKFHKL